MNGIAATVFYKPSEWDIYPMKRDEKYINKIIDLDYCVNTTELELPDGFTLITMDVDNDIELKDVCEFLNRNYSSKMKMFDLNICRWLLSTNHCESFPRIKDARQCIFFCRYQNIIVGSVAARPVTYRVDGRLVCTLEVLWVCVAHELQSRKLGVLLMKELHRRAEIAGLTIGMIFMTPKHLSALPVVGPMKMLMRKVDKSDKSNKSIDMIRIATHRDVNKMMKIYKQYSCRNVDDPLHQRLYCEYNRNEFEHKFLYRDVVLTYVVCTVTGELKDFVSLVLYPNNVVYVQYVSFANEKILEIFMQNVLYIVAQMGYKVVYIRDVGGVGIPLKNSLRFEEQNDAFLYQFNYNTMSIDNCQTKYTGFIV